MSAQHSAIAAILLAAGRSARFGADKLSAIIDGKTVLARSAGALSSAGFNANIAVISNATQGHSLFLQKSGFEIVNNPSAADGISTSIRAGILAAQSLGADAVIIALADMPYVEADHHLRLVQTARGAPSGMAFSISLKRRSPPAFFGKQWFDRLCSLEGDEGARSIIAAAPDAAGVNAGENLLRDIDFAADIRGA